MHTSQIAHLRSMIESGMSDEDISVVMAENEAAAAEHDAMYGTDDAPHASGPAHLSNDEYYSRNDAGEYSWM